MKLWLALLIAVGCGASSPSAPPPTPTSGAAPAPAAPVAQRGSVDVAGLKSVVDGGPALVVDVRTPEEFATGHVPGARNIPVSALPDRLAELADARDKDVYLICAVGGRSARATAMLAEAGFTHPINVEGGTDAWRDAGYPLE